MTYVDSSSDDDMTVRRRKRPITSIEDLGDLMVEVMAAKKLKTQLEQRQQRMRQHDALILRRVDDMDNRDVEEQKNMRSSFPTQLRVIPSRPDITLKLKSVETRKLITAGIGNMLARWGGVWPGGPHERFEKSAHTTSLVWMLHSITDPVFRNLYLSRHGSVNKSSTWQNPGIIGTPLTKSQIQQAQDFLSEFITDAANRKQLERISVFDITKQSSLLFQIIVIGSRSLLEFTDTGSICPEFQILFDDQFT